MLTFKKGNFNKQELNILYDALCDATANFVCDLDGCQNCRYKQPCADITRCKEHVFSLISVKSAIK